MSLADFRDSEDVVEVWEVNERSLEVFLQVGGQWRMSSAGPIAMDHGPLYTRLDRMKLEPHEYDELFNDVCVMADEAIAAMNEKDD
jgi:hypothetical protein